MKVLVTSSQQGFWLVLKLNRDAAAAAHIAGKWLVFV
jgi:hypothetical protein